MLHIYVCDYLCKRGYSQAALALRSEAGLDPARKVPIDAPQSLLFEWWVVFWEIFASRSLDSTAIATTHSADATTYSLSQPPLFAMVEAGSLGSVSRAPAAQKTEPYGARVAFSKREATTFAPQEALGMQPSQSGLAPAAKSVEPPEAPASTSTRRRSTVVSPPPVQQNQAPQKAAPTPLRQLDVEASQKLGLARPASRVVIQQCMGMLNLGSKQIDSLTADEKVTLAKRVSRLQKAQNDAQLRLAQLHGLQPPKSLVGAGGLAPAVTSTASVTQLAPVQQMPSRMFPERSATLHLPGSSAGQKRKEPPSPEAGSERVHGNMVGPEARRSPAAPLLRRLSQPMQVALQSAHTPLTPVDESLPFSQVSPHHIVQYGSASITHTPMNPPLSRPSVLGPGPVLTYPSASGVPTAPPTPLGSSVSLSGEWLGPDSILQQQAGPPLQRQFAMMPNGLTATSNVAFTHPSHLESGIVWQPAQQHPVGPEPNLNHDGNGGLHYSLDPNTSTAKPTVLGLPENPISGLFPQPRLHSHGGTGSALLTPLPELGYDLNVLFSNSTQLNRDEKPPLARQLGGVGGT